MKVSSKTLNEIDEAKEKENLKLLEAVFFVSGRFLAMQDLISLTDLNPIILRELIEKLQEKYSKKESSIEIVQKKNQWKMDVRPEYHNLINKLATGSAEFTKAEQETLAIIAYKHPIKQSVIVKIRGNKSYDHIKKFCDLGLIKKKRMGHTYELSLKDDFYDYFNVNEPSEGGNPLKTKRIDEESQDDTRSNDNEEVVDVEIEVPDEVEEVEVSNEGGGLEASDENFSEESFDSESNEEE